MMIEEFDAILALGTVLGTWWPVYITRLAKLVLRAHVQGQRERHAWRIARYDAGLSKIAEPQAALYTKRGHDNSNLCTFTNSE